MMLLTIRQYGCSFDIYRLLPCWKIRVDSMGDDSMFLYNYVSHSRHTSTKVFTYMSHYPMRTVCNKINESYEFETLQINAQEGP